MNKDDINTDDIILQLRAAFVYRDGILYWNPEIRGRNLFPGSEAGYIRYTKNGKGKYKTVSLRRKRYLVHRIIFAINHGYFHIFVDHINGDILDNRIENLRPVTAQDNSKNQKLNTRNNTGILGVWVTKNGSFCATIAGQYLKITSDFFEACCIRKSAEIAHKFHKNHGRFKEAKYD